MDWRYLLAGSNLIVFAAVMLILGLSSGSVQLTGIAASVFIVGIVITALGLSYTDPLHKLYIIYSETVGSFIERVTEDSGLLDKGKLIACPRKNDVIIAIAPKNVSCNELKPGLLVTSKGEPFIGFKVPAGLIAGDVSDISEPGDLLNYIVVSKYNFSQSVGIRRTAEAIDVVLAGLQPELARGIGRIAEPVKTLVAATLAYSLNKPIRLESWRPTGDSYVLRFSLVDTT